MRLDGPGSRPAATVHGRVLKTIRSAVGCQSGYVAHAEGSVSGVSVPGSSSRLVVAIRVETSVSREASEYCQTSRTSETTSRLWRPV